MIKINNKGFMMAEVIIVSTVIVTVLVALYASFVKMYTVYDERSYYYNVDGVYALKTLYNELIDDGKMVDLINNEEFKNNNYIEFKCDIFDNESSNKMCTSLMGTYKVKKIYFFKYDIITIDDDSFISYIDYLNSSMDFEDNFSYMFIIEFKNDSNSYYSNYRLG